MGQDSGYFEASGARTPNHNKTVKNSKNSDSVSLKDLKKLAKKHHVLSSGKSKGELTLLIFNISATGLSTEELKKLSICSPVKKKERQRK